MEEYKAIFVFILMFCFVVFTAWDIYKSKTIEGKAPFLKQRSIILAMIAIIGFTVAFIDKIPFLVAILISILLFYLELVTTNIYLFKDLKTQIIDGEDSVKKKLDKTTEELKDVSSQLMDYNTHPIIATKDSFKQSTEKLFLLTSLKEIALEFALDSLEQLNTKAYIQIDTELNYYTKNLSLFIEKSKTEIIGTYTLRPKIIYEQFIDPETSSDFINYLKTFKEKNLSKKRIVVFELEEIIAILEEALFERNGENFALIEKRRKDAIAYRISKMKEGNQEYQLSEIPEIVWFEENICCENTDLVWTLTPIFLKYLDLENTFKDIIQPNGNLNYMSDFAIFDNEVLVTWRESNPKYFSNQETKPTGTMLMNWSGSTTLVSNKINNISTDCLIKNNFNELLSDINNIDTINCHQSNINSKSLIYFKQLYKVMNDNLNSGKFWSNQEYRTS